MKRIFAGVALALVAAAAVGAVWLWQRVSTLEHASLTPDVHVILGAGGNVGVLATERGAVVVDTMTFRMQGERIARLAERLTGAPVKAILNTHYHRDHTHGNPAFAPGLPVIATERTRAHLLARDADYWKGAAAETLPNVLFDDEHALRLGAKTIRAIHPGRGHTDGDLVVLFVEDGVLHAGDLLFQRRYPRVDLEAGGSFPGWVASLERVLELEFEQVIPGHGAVTDRAGVADFRDFLAEVWTQAEAAAREGRTLEQFLDRARLTKDAGYARMYVPFLLKFDRDSVLRSAWREAAGG